MALVLDGNGTMTVGNGDITGLVAGALPSTVIGAGAVLQVVQGTTTTPVARTSGGLADTGLTATITPSSATSKILVYIHQNGIRKQAANCYMEFYLLRGASSIATLALAQSYTATTADSQSGTVSITYLDSPATTSATTYKTQFAYAGNSGGTCTIQVNSDVSTITLMEIAV